MVHWCENGLKKIWIPLLFFPLKINQNFTCSISLASMFYNQTFLLKKFTKNCQNLKRNRRYLILYTWFNICRIPDNR